MISIQDRCAEPSRRLTTLTPRPRSVSCLHHTRMRLAAPARWSATLAAQTEVKEMLPSPDLRMADSGCIVLEAHGVEERVAHAQELRPRRQNRHSYDWSRVNPRCAHPGRCRGACWRRRVAPSWRTHRRGRFRRHDAKFTNVNHICFKRVNAG